MTDPINVDKSPNAEDDALENADQTDDSVTGTPVPNAVGRKKSFMNNVLPANTTVNPMIKDVSNGPTGENSGFPNTSYFVPLEKPKLKSSTYEDGLRLFTKKYWIADSSRLGITFGNRNVHKQGEPYVSLGSNSTNQAGPPFTLHIEPTDLQFAFSNVGNIAPGVNDIDPGHLDENEKGLLCDDRLEDPRVKPSHPEHKDFLVYGLGMSSHTELVGDERLERIVFTRTGISNDPEGLIQNQADWNFYCGQQKTSTNYSGIRLQLPVYETLVPPAVLQELQDESGYNPLGQTEVVMYNPETGYDEEATQITNYGATGVSYGGSFTYADDSPKKNIFNNLIYLGKSGTNSKKRHSYEIERILSQDNQYAIGKAKYFHELPTYQDHIFSYSTPTSNKIATDTNAQVKSMTYTVEANYNTFLSNYEQATKWDGVPESLLPSVYMFLTEMKNEDTNWLEYLEHITLHGSIFPEQMQNWLGENGGFLKTSTKGSTMSPVAYFREFANRIRDFSDTDVAQNIVQKYSRTGFTFESLLDIMNDARQKSFIFPMNISLSFNTDNKTTVANLMKESKLTNMFFKTLSYGSSAQIRPFVSFHEEAKQYLDESTGEIKVESLTLTSPGDSYKVWPLESFKNEVDSSAESSFTVDSESNYNATMLGYGDKVDLTDPQNYFYKYLMTTLFSAKLKKLVKKHTRSYLDILKGKQAYNETLFYRIEKRRRPNQESYDEAYNGESSAQEVEAGTLVQTIFLPNSNELDVFEYIDTQVKYGYKYDYNVTAYQLVLGTEYKLCRAFTDTKQAALNKDEIAQGKDLPVAWSTLTHVLSRPSPVIMEVPYFGNLNSDKVTASVIDDPPPPPDFDIEPYKGYANKILINVSSNTGEVEMDPIVIEEKDFKKFSDVYISQNINPPQGPIRFSSDDSPTVFQIFRCNKPPASYSDFKGKMIKELSSGAPDFITSFVDDVQANKKYYYTFRVVDDHSWISNPTDIMQVELVNNDGAIFLLQEEYQFPDPEDDFVTTKNMKKYLYIEPVQDQVTVDYSQMEIGLDQSAYTISDADLPKLGMKNEKLIGKKFKIRIKSKNTGKVFDLNFQFAHDHLPADKSTLAAYMYQLQTEEE